MRKSLLSLFVLAIAVAPILIGCSGKEEADTSAPTTAPKATNDPSKPPSNENVGGNKPATPL